MSYAFLIVRRAPVMPFASSLLAALLGLSACAESSSTVLPSSDGSIDIPLDHERDTSLDAAEEGLDVQDAGASDAPDVGVDASVDACSIEEPEGGACDPAERQRAWCGRCGRKQRVCGTSGVWGDWGVCVEDPEAECSPCESSSAPCGNCGRQAVWCDTSNERCRWVRGACDATGECPAGAFEARAGGCQSGLAELRWCDKTCAWEDWSGACAVSPHWEAIAKAPLEPRVDFAWGMGSVWGGASPTGNEVFGDGATYEHATDSWTKIPPAAFEPPDGGVDGSVPATFSARRAMASSKFADRLFVFGGEDASGEPLGDGAIWSEAEGWRPINPDGAPSPRSGATVVGGGTPRVIVFGGRGGFGAAAPGGALYDVDADEWSPLPDAPFGDRQEHTAVVETVGGRVIVWGGRGGNGEPPSAQGAIYDPETNTWSPMADAPIRRAGHFAAWDQRTKRMIVLFGYDDQWPGHRGDGAAYDPASDTWSWLPDIATTGVVPTDGTAVIEGAAGLWIVGEDRGAKLDVDVDVWAPIPDPSKASEYLRGWYVLTSLDDGNPIVWGTAGGEALRGYPEPSFR
jgi:Kelch motif